jgi:hypothetical protein
MKKLILLLLLPMAAMSQKMPDIVTNRVRINEPDQSIVFEINLSSNDVSTDLDKHYYWYSGNTVHTTQGGFSGKLLHGQYTAYFLNKNLKEQGRFKNGLKDGPWKEWNENGSLKSEHPWSKGVESGKFYTYDTTGRLSQSGYFKNGLMNGKSVIYLGGDSTRKVNYKNGVLSARSLSLLQKLRLKIKRDSVSDKHVKAEKAQKEKANNNAPNKPKS